MIRRWLGNVAVAFDQLGNAMLGGDPDETISSRAAKAAHGSGWWRLGRLLEAIDPGHLKSAREADEGGDVIWRQE